MREGAKLTVRTPKWVVSDTNKGRQVMPTLPTKPAVCTKYCIVKGRRSEHAGNMLESTVSFPAIFFAAIIGTIVFIAVSQLLLDPHE